MSDVESALVIHDLFRALGFERFTIRINDRRLLTGVLEHLGLVERQTDVLRALDKLADRRREGRRRAGRAACPTSQPGGGARLRLLKGHPAALLEHDGRGRWSADWAYELAGGDDVCGALFEGGGRRGADPARFALDPSIARGLDFYTGTIYEAFLDDHRGIGGCCSGGRYDDLAGLYTKQHLPGVGASLRRGSPARGHG